MPLPGLLSTDPAAMGNYGLAMGLLQGGAPSRMPTYFGQALGQGLGIGSQMMLEAQNANARRALIEAETQNRALQAEMQRYQLESSRKSEAAIQDLAQSLDPSLRQQFLANPQKFLEAMAKQMEPYTLSPGQQRQIAGQATGYLPPTPTFQQVPVPGQPGVTQPTWLTPGQATGVPVGGPAMPEILNPAIQQARIAVARAGAPSVNVQNYPNPIPVTLPSGETGLVQFGNRGEMRVTPFKPAPETKPPTDTEQVASGYAERMIASESVIERIGMAGVPTAQTASAGMIGPTIERFAQTPDQQVYSQAQADWVRAKLRKESGAVIADEEMNSEIRTYFPQYGDSPEVIKRKAEARKTATEAMIRSAGKAMQQRQVPQAPNAPTAPVGGGWRIVK